MMSLSTGNLPFPVAREHMGLGARFMNRKIVSRSLLFVVVAVAVIAFAIPALANPALSLGTPSVFASLNSNIAGAFFLKHDGWGNKDDKCKWEDEKWGKCGKPKYVVASEEPSLMQLACVLALFVVVIPRAGLLRRKVSG